MTTYKDISISISGTGIRSLGPNEIIYILGPGTIFYYLYSRNATGSKPFLKSLSNRRHSNHPQSMSDDYSRVTILHLKIYIAWHDGEHHRDNMDPWDLVVFPAGERVPFRDEVRLVDIANGVYGKHGMNNALTIVNKERRRGWKAWWSGKREEDRLVPQEVEEIFRSPLKENVDWDWGDVSEDDLEKR